LATGIPARLTPAEGRKFAFTVGTAFLVIAAFTWWRGHENVRNVTAVLGTTLLVAGILVPGYLGPVYRGWMKFGLLLSKVTTPIILSIMYYLVITPVGIVRGLFAGNTLIPDRKAATFWHDRPAGTRRGDLKRQF
jgi:hypothetical protein